MPYPLNLGTAKEVEAIIRTNGAVPATVAILDGIPCVGVYIKLFLVYIFIYVHLLIKKKKNHICTLRELTVEEVLSSKSSVRQ